jgi:hypothetical protein
MTHHELNLAVARATGESLQTIRRRGFSLADPDVADCDPEPCDIEEKVLDWDAVQSKRRISLFPQRSRRAALV